ncbi:MAG: biotin/lipoyl-binding protein [Planctomycetes bacterium]|nr:biotin/lipoyl-binding protein [Planctomycetota bacterium]
MNTSFRDGFQSVYGARVFTRDFLPAVEAARDAGIMHHEAGGGARFQSLYFYCNEDAFVMMDAFRAAAGVEANLQTLARGINVVGLESQSRDVVRLHAELFKKHSITTIRNFDALNDVNNLIYSGQCIADAGLDHEVVITLMELPPGCEGAHTPEFYIDTLRGILDAGIPYSSVCFKDASGTAVPSKVYETVRLARQLLPDGTHIRVHTHETAGIGVLAYRAALDAGADGIDLAMAPCSGGTSQPDIATMWHALRGTDFDLGLDIDKVMQAEAVFKECMKDYFLPPEATKVEPLIPWSPMPGGALTANTQMLRDNNIMDKYPEVIAAMGETVRRGGFGTSVTPVSQFYFQQAFNNVMFGPWEKFAPGYGKMVLGYFGKTPVPPDPEIVKLASEKLDLEPTTRSPLDINDEDPGKGCEAANQKLKEAQLEITDENTFIAATCGDKGIAFLKGQAKTSVRKIEPEKKKKPTGPQSYIVNLSGRDYAVTLDGSQAMVDGQKYEVEVKESQAVSASVDKSASAGTEDRVITAQLPGSIIKIIVKTGDAVKEGDPLMVIEAMKMESEIKSGFSGRVTAIPVSVGDQVAAGDVLVRIG